MELLTDRPKPTMSDRRAELERKKAKLQALREEKERRRREKELKDVKDATDRAHLVAGGDRKELDEMLSEVGVAPLSEVYSSISSANSLTPEPSRNHTPDTSLQPNSLPNNVTAVRKKAPQLSVVPVQTTSIPPKEVVVYTKQTQTTATGHELRDGYMEDWWRPRKDEYNLNPGLEWEDEFTVLTYDDPQGEDEENSLPHIGVSKLPPGILPHGLPQVKEVQPAVTQVEQEAKKEQEQKEIQELSEEEKQIIILSEDFQQFIDRTGRVMERALCEFVDIYTDYTGTGEETLDEKSYQRISFNRTFYDERWSKNRTVTSFDWSPQFPELLLASYNNNEESPNDPDGVVLVWNTKFKKTTPEYIFHCQSAVLSTTFARFHPNLILGGTYSGQLVLWDNRVQKRTPIQRTPLSTNAHTHPVYCMAVVGTQNAHNLISISTDGKMCFWSLDMLGVPQETLNLHRAQAAKPVAVTCMDFPSSDFNNFVVGSEEGTAYSACRHGAKAGITESYDAHTGPITGISVNGAQGGIDFSHMFLTSSFDWTIKLWNLKETKPLYSFDNSGDYVLDVKWSPVHPAMFATVDCCGRLDLWNLNQNTEVPAASVAVEGMPALNKVAWTPSGLHVTVGDNMGRIHVYDVSENFAHPRHDEWNKFLYTTQELRNNQVDEEKKKNDVSKNQILDLLR
ncbi:cytoplasmic dynein 1 intermediate chain short wing isoform X7 [Rhynchophorus ferrugineus]|uniref:cytoplasmic dynein 1 intermediate chain short wing isoform X7 n=2 Tax=Rhynchophorus ferrugineus TaxID=354439 RepID=UPI003FCC9E71